MRFARRSLRGTRCGTRRGGGCGAASAGAPRMWAALRMTTRFWCRGCLTCTRPRGTPSGCSLRCSCRLRRTSSSGMRQQVRICPAPCIDLRVSNFVGCCNSDCMPGRLCAYGMLWPSRSSWFVPRFCFEDYGRRSALHVSPWALPMTYYGEGWKPSCCSSLQKLEETIPAGCCCRQFNVHVE